jgi:hypothetical protein
MVPAVDPILRRRRGRVTLLLHDARVLAWPVRTWTPGRRCAGRATSGYLASLAAQRASGEIRRAVDVDVIGARILSDGLDQLWVDVLHAAADRVRAGERAAEQGHHDRARRTGVQYHRPEMSSITHLFAGVPVSDLDASIDWYTRFFGRPPDSRFGDEILWEIDERAWLFIEPNAAQAGAGRITLAVAGLDAHSSALLPSV